MTDLAGRAIDTDAANFQLGNETFPLAHATFVRNRETPDIYDANHVTAPQARTPAEIDELLAATDREFDFANHRRFDVDYRTPQEFVARLLLDGGYERSDTLISVLEGELNGAPKHWEIRPATDDSWDSIWDLTLLDFSEHQRRVGRPVDDGVARRIWMSKKTKQPPVQYSLAYDSERPVGYFNWWEGVGGIGQVEDLFTHPDYRKRGVATALIQHCVAQCRAKGASPVVIASDPTDTPKNIYARMGFRPVAIQAKYLKRLTPE